MIIFPKILYLLTFKFFEDLDAVKFMSTNFGTHITCSIPWTAPVACLAWRSRILAGDTMREGTDRESSLDHDADFQQLIYGNTGNPTTIPSLVPVYKLGMLSGLWKGEMMASDIYTPS